MDKIDSYLEEDSILISTDLIQKYWINKATFLHMLKLQSFNKERFKIDYDKIEEVWLTRRVQEDYINFFLKKWTLLCNGRLYKFNEEWWKWIKNANKILRQVMYDKRLNWWQKVIFFVIYDIIKNKSACYVSNRYIWEKLWVSTHTVSNNISKLIKLWYIKGTYEQCWDPYRILELSTEYENILINK